MRASMTSLCLMLLLGIAPSSDDPLVGTWALNLARSHYGGGAEVRREETFTCQASREFIKCEIESIRADGRRLVGTFSAAYDGRPYPAAGIPDVDQVSLQKLSGFVADATFSFRGKPVFGYRAVRSDDGRSLTVVSVEPTTRVIGNSVIVYDRK